jgi:hypothetical protein
MEELERQRRGRGGPEGIWKRRWGDGTTAECGDNEASCGKGRGNGEMS